MFGSISRASASQGTAWFFVAVLVLYDRHFGFTCVVGGAHTGRLYSYVFIFIFSTPGFWKEVSLFNCHPLT